MAGRTPARTTTAVVPTQLSREALLALLGQAGEIPQGGDQFHRMKLDGGTLTTDDGQVFFPQKSGPSLQVRIVKPPVYYNAFFLADDNRDGSFDAGQLGRSDMNGRFARQYDDPAEQAADTNAANALYDDIARITGKRGSFKGDLQLQIVPESGELSGDEPIYTLSLSTTSVFEWRGTSRNPGEGSVNPDNFIIRLAEFASKQAAEAGQDEDGQTRHVLNAMTALRLGYVFADVYLQKAENDDRTRSWWVVAFFPIHIEPLGEAAQLASGEDTSDDVPL